MATVWAVFNGGVNYSPGSVHELRDIEEFPSLRAAGDALWSRVSDRMQLVDRASASMHIWLACPNDGHGDVTEYPDGIATIGPRGGVRVWRV
jgi:hypothetical protein